MQAALSFRLSDEFIAKYTDAPVKWGFPSAKGMSVGEFTFLRTYSNKLEDGSKEHWHETVRRVVEGSFSLQKEYALSVTHTRWDEERAQRSAQEMYERLYNFKFWAPGRGLENMGTKGVNGWGYSDRLYNCAFQSTKHGGTEPFAKLFAKSMRGIGVGYDTLGAGLDLLRTPGPEVTFPIPDTTEGWVDSTKALLNSYYYGTPKPRFQYWKIRPKGALISSGGVAPGPEPLRKLHQKLDEYYSQRIGQRTSSRTIVDTCNLIGKAVVAGGKRRTALISLGRMYDKDFWNLKDPSLPENADRLDHKTGWAWASNNSLVTTSDAPPDFKEYATSQINAEPGIFVSDLVQNYGRLKDGYNFNVDAEAIGTNPCGEISLEDDETCNVASVNMANHTSISDFLRTMKFVFLYAKSVTLMPTTWPDTNLVQMRNRRIGISLTGIAQFLSRHSMDELRKWMNLGYRELKEWDKIYSKWFGVRESIKLTTIKPEGTASLLAGATPGVHYPVHSTYIRRIQLTSQDPLLDVLADAGYHIEEAIGHEGNTMVVEIPVRGPKVVSERELSVAQKLDVALLAQHEWADNSVSFTLTYWPSEEDELARVLEESWGQYKSITCMPIYADESGGRERQLPYEGISDLTYERMCDRLREVDLSKVYSSGMEQVGDRFCEGDKCLI